MAKAVPRPAVTWRGKPVPDAFVCFSTGFHQDAFVLHATLEEVVAMALGMVYPQERTALAGYLRRLLGGKYDDSDLKGLWNRMPSAFFAARGVRQVLEEALKQIETGEPA